MDARLFAAFTLASVLLAVFPGPNMALIVANSVRRGTRFGLLTLGGTMSGVILQLALVAVGLSALLQTAGVWFDALRLIGAAYLVFIGVQSWRAPPPLLDSAVGALSARATYLRGLAVSMTNPKLLLFFGAFFPQFVSPDHPAAPQLVVMSVTFVTVATLFDGAWALLAGRARGWIVRRGRWVNRVSGGLLVGAGLGVALARR